MDSNLASYAFLPQVRRGGMHDEPKEHLRRKLTLPLIYDYSYFIIIYLFNNIMLL